MVLGAKTRALLAGRAPDPKPGAQAKQRSLHNNYLTLPVIFLMLSNHYPLAFATQFSWIIAALVFLMGVTIRHYFNSLHARKGNPHWTWGVTILIFLVIAWLSTAGQHDTLEEAEARPLTATETVFAQAPGFAEAHDIILGRCSMCHAREPVWEGMLWAPKGVLLETRGDIARNAQTIYVQAGITHAMPPANITELPQADRQKIIAWYRTARAGL